MEFYQRSAHPTIPAAHRMMPAPAHHQYLPDPQLLPPSYAPPQYAASHHTEPYSAPPRRLPSVSELLVPQQQQQQQQVAAASPARNPPPAPYAISYAHSDRPPQSHPQHAAAYTDSSAYAVEPQKPLGIDVPKSASASHHRDSESASSVSSQTTLVDNYSPQLTRQPPAFKQPPSSTNRTMYEDDVFTAARILMSLRTCKMPC
ncbi:hypothetical protein IWW48_004046 [Coemansia sp. RSA 1200]|nr:hypothetical protein IWW48_004046 [Coemansia sp. RSA 1200]